MGVMIKKQEKNEKGSAKKNIMRNKHRTKRANGTLSISESVMKCIRRDIWLYVFLAPALIYLLIFKYAPMLGMVIGFKRLFNRKKEYSAASGSVLTTL
ncbi:MAG: hypothetical protein L6V93_22550 [Clostridiales bacterium]|nr:MAG: hypothetical protein L6V93_22550 [Clostridiales bacterium]